MCGNFGLIIVQQQNENNSDSNSKNINDNENLGQYNLPDLDESIHRSMDEVRRAHGLLLASDITHTHSSHDHNNNNNNNNTSLGMDSIYYSSYIYEPLRPLLDPSKILQEQTACTEVRGGQAGGISAFDYLNIQSSSTSGFDAQFVKTAIATVEPIHSR